MACFDIRYNIERDGKFWVIECVDYPVFTQGKTKEEAKEHLKEAFLLYAGDKDAQLRHPELRQIAALENPANQDKLPEQEAVVDLFITPITSTYGSLTSFIR